MDKIKMLVRCMKRTASQFRRMYLVMNEKKNCQPHLLAMIIKHIHSIEKGLAMKHIRPGFGLPRITKMLTYIEKYVQLTGDMKPIECSMAYSVIKKYVEYHENIKFSNNEYELVKQRAKYVFESYEKDLRDDMAGILHINTKEIEVDLQAFEHCVMTRHSIRDFSNQPVSEELLKKAISLAMHAPSACNRQSTRVYILDHSKFDTIDGWTGGVKTFLDSVDKMLIITGQMSAYEKDEFWQYSVSASIFVGYLTLALHAVGLGGCLLQRPLLSDSHWRRVAQTHGIPDDEQVVCAMAIGVPEEEVKVPQSQRLEYNRIVKQL